MMKLALQWASKEARLQTDTLLAWFYMMNRIKKKRMDHDWKWVSLAGEGAGVVDEEGAAAEEPSEGDGPDQKPSRSCNKAQG